MIQTAGSSRDTDLMPDPAERVLILDFRGQVTQLIARRQRVYREIWSFNAGARPGQCLAAPAQEK